MSFRRKRDEWDEFLKQHGSELRACGIPDAITSDRGRFLRFLDHGFDQDGWWTSRPCTPWSISFLTPDEAIRFANFLTRYFGEEAHPHLIRELRQRAGRG
ncbi:hypothetical protein J8F10_30215 [Gemmata sp. G18]|uniref:Uncharacterized protein n=1 Tax=Gemmata palustris TaxID=2822762 RepID=A0ABS5C251_9BACT|nr:hypothetical protein [Gemmata palustris]MBP3959540.1 hypothetical protein [Gemmata palustris]